MFSGLKHAHKTTSVSSHPRLHAPQKQLNLGSDGYLEFITKDEKLSDTSATYSTRSNKNKELQYSCVLNNHIEKMKSPWHNSKPYARRYKVH